MHLAVNNIIVWYKSILTEALNEYFLEILNININLIRNANKTDIFQDNTNLIDCYDPDKHIVKKFAVG